MKWIKQFKLFELNTTENKEERLLNLYFGIESDDIQDWFQDLLDDWSYLNFEIEVIDIDYFSIFFKDEIAIKDRIPGNIDKNSHHISDDYINFINSRLIEYELKIVGINYDTSKQYLELLIKKNAE
jgi:hypothetical protein